MNTSIGKLKDRINKYGIKLDIDTDSKFQHFVVQGEPSNQENWWCLLGNVDGDDDGPNVALYGCIERNWSKIWYGNIFEAMNDKRKRKYKNILKGMRSIRKKSLSDLRNQLEAYKSNPMILMKSWLAGNVKIVGDDIIVSILAKLTDLDYERVRDRAAKKMGLPRVGSLDKKVERTRKIVQSKQLSLPFSPHIA
ncbi:hypothetical protein [Geobacter sp. AOG2]|uniref:hypothetical protein n=1 Tax=Geobacter sp. AOG2 TaxID=1566347 RepID=UPI001CC3A5A6|nr:hypothetical protein [Geobacter sp. AOG2]GFE60585.1 hypothetical protein AOG2_11730 [Geobacter sp. AOG2]